MNNRIKELREAAGLTQAQVAAAANTSTQQVSRLERGERRLTLDWMVRLAKAIGCTWEEVAADPDNPRAPLTMLRVVATVQAGVWAETWEWDLEDQYLIDVPARGQYAGLPRFGLEVKGRSMDVVFPEGTVLICVRFFDVGRPPAAGERVIVLRRNRYGQIEATVKELVLDDDGQAWLWPRSTHPSFQSPTRLPTEFEPIDDGSDFGVATADGLDDGDAEAFTVFALVVASYRTEPMMSQ